MTKASPFVENRPCIGPTTWLEPKLVVEVSFEDRTPDGLLRAPVFLGCVTTSRRTSVRNAPQNAAAKTKPSLQS